MITDSRYRMAVFLPRSDHSVVIAAAFHFTGGDGKKPRTAPGPSTTSAQPGTGLPEASIDVAYSVSVLEHVPPHDIARILRESARIVAPGGAILHSIACCDHYAFFDRSITFLNYLQYDERAWRKWNNALQYQNRLRAPDFLGLVAAGGFRTVSEYPHRDPHTLARLDELKLAPEFHKYSREEWSVTSLGLVAVREPS